MEKNRFFIIGTALMISLCVLVLLVDSEAEGTEPTRAEGDFCTFTGRNLNSYNRPGDVDTFNIRAQNIYDGHLWREDSYEYSSFTLYYARLGIDHMNILDENLEMTYDLIEETAVGSLAPDNGPKGTGYNISNGGYFNYYNDQDLNKELSFRVKRMNVKAGTYNLPVTLSFIVRTSYDETSSDGFSYSSLISVKGHILLTVESNIIGVYGAPRQLTGMEGSSSIPIYAGARDIALVYGNVHSLSSVDLEGFGFLLESIPGEVTLPGTIRTLGTLDYNSKKVSWKMDISNDATPREYSMNLFFEYKKIGVDHREGPYKVMFKIAPSPLIVPKYGANDLEPMVELVQGIGTNSIGMTLINQGNVMIETGKIVLDLDSALHLSTNSFYFDEGDYSNRVYPPIEIPIEDLGPGQELVGSFPPITIDETIPPGDYYVPLDYQCYYRDPYEDPAVAMLVSSYQMDEVGENDFMEIMYFRNSPRDPYQRGPHLIMRILEDGKGTDIRATVGPVLKAGTTQNELVYRFENMEQYPLRSISLSIRSMDPLSLYCSYNKTGDDYLADITGLQVPAADIDGPGILEVTVLVNVPLNTSSTTVGTHIRLTGRDILNKLEVKDLTLPVAISAYIPEPEIKVLSILSTEVEPGKDFELTLQIMNAGDGYLTGLEIVLVSNSSKTYIKDPYRSVSELPPSAIESVTFSCAADGSMMEGETCCLYLMAQYNDAIGQLHSYSEDEPIPIMISSVPPKGIEESTDGLFYLMIGLIVSAMFVSLAFVACALIVMIMRRSGKEDTGKVDVNVGKSDAVSENGPKDGPGLVNTTTTEASPPTPPNPASTSPFSEPTLPPMKSAPNKPFSALDDLFDGTATDKL